MITVTPERFDELLDQALVALPEWVTTRMDNVVVTSAAGPSGEQQRRVRRRGALLGLYEGVPLSHRGGGYHLTPPDRITLFRGALQWLANDEADLVRLIRQTVVHEVGHHFGMSEDELRAAGV